MKIKNVIGLCVITVIFLSVSGCTNKNQTAILPLGGTLTQIKIGNPHLVFNYNGTGNYEIYVMTTAGVGATQLTNNAAYDNWWPRISPDRTKVLFYRVPAGTAENIKYQEASLWVMNADGTGVSILRAKGADGWSMQAHAEWSPDGNEIVMCGGIAGVPHIVVTNTRGSVKRQITTDGTWNCDPSWSTDGTIIVFNRMVTGSDFANLEINTIPSGGGTITSLTSNSLADYDPYYSPDGATIAWLQNVNPAGWGGLGVWAIKKMNANGSSQVDVINDGQINSKPAWSLDGTTIYFHRLEPLGDLRWEIFKIATPFVTGSQTRVDAFTTGNCEYPMN